MKEKLKKLFKSSKAKVAASAAGGVSVILLTILFIWLLSSKNQDKSLATSKTRKGLSQQKKGVNNTTDKPYPINKSNNHRKIHGIIKATEEEVSSSKDIDSTAERKNQVPSKNEAGLKRKKQDPGTNPPLSLGETNENASDQKRQTGHEPPQQPLPNPEMTPPKPAKDCKAEFDAALNKFNRDGDASEIPSLSEALKNMLEESHQPQQTLCEYLKENYEIKRDTVLGVKVAGEKDLNDLNLLLKGLIIVEPSYSDELLEVQFAKRFVPPFLEAFQKLESKVVAPEDADLAMEAINAFALAQVFSNLPPTVPKEVRDKFSHDSFKYKNLITYLEQLIPKLINEAKDAATESTALNYIRILRLLNPKSPHAYEGKDSLDEIRQSIQPPSILSYFVLQDAPQQIAIQTIDSVKNLSIFELDELYKQISDKIVVCKAQGKNFDLAVCEANLALVDVFLFGRSNWNAEIFVSWMNTGFKTARCPEFLNWIEHDQALNGRSKFFCDEAPAPKDFYFLEYVRKMHGKRANAFSFSDSKTSAEEFIQQQTTVIAYEGFRLSPPGSEARKCLVKFLETESIEDTKSFSNSLSEYPEGFYTLVKNSCLVIHMILKRSNLSIENSLAYEMLHYMQKLQDVKVANSKSDFGAKLDSLEESTDFDVAYQWWTECNNNNKEECSKVFRDVAYQHLLEKKIKTLEVEREAFKLSGKRTELPIMYSEGKLGLIAALRAYIAMRYYFDNAKFNELEKNVISEFKFPNLPTDCNSLNISTFKKHSSLHRNSIEYVQLSSYRKEWTSFEAILRSMDNNRKITEAAEEKRNFILLLKDILKECTKKEKCKTDPTKNIIICTKKDFILRLEKFSNLKGELETYCLDILDEAIQTDDHTKLNKKLNTELDLIACNLKVSICDDFEQFESSSDSKSWMRYFNWVDGKLISTLI